ncbi:MAG TPA: phosphatase PAP2 family protein [Candidatus Tumulicola sp.]
MKALAVAVVALAAFLALGFAVVRGGEPGALIGWEVVLANHGALIAWWLTWACYPQLLGPLAIALLIVAWRVPSWRARIVFSIIMLVLCWQGADLFQHFFMRPRRLDWIVRREAAFSYPSSHAAIVTGFYLLWARMIAVSDLPRAVRATLPALLAALAAAVCWSRLALGAHYLTDLAGGALLAIAIVSVALAAYPLKGFVRPAGV